MTVPLAGRPPSEVHEVLVGRMDCIFEMRAER